MVCAQSYGIYIVSQGFLKGDIHPAPDIPGYDQGCFVNVHHAQGCPCLCFSALKAQAQEFTCNAQSRVTRASFSRDTGFASKGVSAPITPSKSNTVTSL